MTTWFKTRNGLFLAPLTLSCRVLQHQIFPGEYKQRVTKDRCLVESLPRNTGIAGWLKVRRRKADPRARTEQLWWQTHPIYSGGRKPATPRKVPEVEVLNLAKELKRTDMGRSFTSCLFFFFFFHEGKIDIPHCIGLRYTTYWFSVCVYIARWPPRYVKLASAIIRSYRGFFSCDEYF